MKKTKKLACVLAIISLTGCVPTGLQDKTAEEYKKQYEQFEKKGPSAKLDGSSQSSNLDGPSQDSNLDSSSKKFNKTQKKSIFQKIKKALGFGSKSKQEPNKPKKNEEKSIKKTSKNTNDSKKENTSSSKKENTNKTNHDPYKVLVTSSVENGEQQIVYSISNNGKRSVAVDATIHFYDENNKEISNCTDTFLCLDSGESAVSFFKKENVPDSFNDYKIKLSIHEVSVNSQKRNVIYSQSEDDSNASISGRNESSTVLSSTIFNIIYMMDSNPVFCTTVTLSDIQPGADFSPTIPNIQEASGSDIEYNNCQIILKDAFSY